VIARSGANQQIPLDIHLIVGQGLYDYTRLAGCVSQLS
jgi:hypothetical protein